MCGIAGFVQPSFSTDRSPAVTLAMLAMLAHRGPDEHGYYVDDHAAFGATRLAVIDPDGGKQPFHDGGGRYWIVYNGEVYNYRELREQLTSRGRVFSTRSDTEVALQAWMEWGASAFERFNGGFALAIYDSLTRTLVLARDRWGKRPLYYTTLNGDLVFASEMKAFLEYPGVPFEWDVARLRSCFTLWTPLSDETPFQGIRQVPPGSSVVRTPDGLSEHAYTSLDFAPAPFVGSEEDAIDATRQQLSDSVRLRLRSDVEVGAYLSGGLDSAIVTALAAELSNKTVHTFSVSFADRQFDESEEQATASEFLGTAHASLVIESGDIARAFPEALWFAEVPVFRTAFVPMFLLSHMVRDRGIEVVLTGEGSDEIFLGYDIFRETVLRQRWHQMSPAARQQAIRDLYPHEPHFTDHNVRVLAAAFQDMRPEADATLFSHRTRLTNSSFAGRLLAGSSDGLQGLRAAIARAGPAFDRLSAIGKAQWIESLTLMTGYLLSTQGDRMAFAHGVETRCPFLDPGVASLGNSLPLELRLRNMQEEKYILKRAFAGRLPHATVAKRKRPYVAPDVAPFAGPTAPDYVLTLFSRDELARVGVFDVTLARRLAEKVAAARPEHISPRESQAFLLMLSVMWLDRYFVRRQYSCPTLRSSLVVASDLRTPRS